MTESDFRLENRSLVEAITILPGHDLIARHQMWKVSGMYKHNLPFSY